jgi:hypothetical protein
LPVAPVCGWAKACSLMGRLADNGSPDEQETGNPSVAKQPKRRGHMFLVDVPTFAEVCSLGDVDAAAAYLILAAGTGGDNRTSTWSREAVNQRTALNWRKADAAMSKLEQHGFIRWLTAKGVRKPRIDLTPVETRKAMQKHVAALADRIMHGEQPSTPTEKGAATIGRDLGWLACDADGVWSFIPDRPIVKAYLPMSVVGDTFGMPAGGTTIVDRIRKARDPMALQLLVDLYALQDLAEHGGVNRYWLEEQFTRGETSAATGSIVVWTFKRSRYSARVGHETSPFHHHWRSPTAQEKADNPNVNGAHDFYERLHILEDAGAVEWVYYLAEEATDNGASPIYPVGVKRNGMMVWTELESAIGSYAIRAACAIGSYPGQAVEWESRAPAHFILPAERLARKAALVGVPRLRHRARTTNTARWRKELVEGAAELVQMFRGLIAEKAPELLADADRRFADFNVEFNASSTLVQRDINDTSWSGNHIPSANAEAGFRPRDVDNWLDGVPGQNTATGERF